MSARADWQVLAAVDSVDGANLRRGPGTHRKVVALLVDGEAVRLLDGPSIDGWYRVEAIARADIPSGWIAGELLAFVSRARAVEDLPMLASPGDWSSEFAAVSHGFAVTLIGPDLGDWILVRSGDRTGYVSAWPLANTDDPETDPHAEYWVDVDRSAQIVRLCVGESVVDAFDAQLSADQGEDFYATATGTYRIYQKLVGPTYTPYADAYFEYWAGFDSERYNGFHSWVTDADGNVLPNGRGATAGCVATSLADAKAIYEFVDLGTRIEIHW